MRVLSGGLRIIREDSGVGEAGEDSNRRMPRRLSRPEHTPPGRASHNFSPGIDQTGYLGAASASELGGMLTSPKPSSVGPRHTQLLAWKACHELAIQVHRSCRTWPTRDGRHRADQARRAAFSAAATMAEGAAKRGAREFRRYLDMSLGSLAELSYSLLLARDLGTLPAARWGELEALRDHAGQLTWGLYAAIARRARRPPASNPPPRRSIQGPTSTPSPTPGRSPTPLASPTPLPPTLP